METWRVQVRLPSTIMAMVQVEQNRTGETVASIVRRCVRNELDYAFRDPAYANLLSDLHRSTSNDDGEEGR